MPLTIAPMNTELHIVKIAVTDERIRKHLESLGFVLDAKITILSRNTSGNIIQIHDGRLALDHDISRRIFVA